jgi:transcriptional regulator with XRE-family HTH domain
VSRIEQGLVSPTVEMLARLTAACDDELVLAARPRNVPFDDDQLAGQAARSMENRLELALGWNQFASEIAGKALAALGDG